MSKKNIYINLFIALIFLLSTSFTGCANTSEKPTPENIIKSYIEVSTWEDKLKYVLHPDDEKSKMEKYYKDFKPVSGKIKYDFKEINKYDSYTACFTQITYPDNSSTNVQYILIKENDTYKIDWEASVVYNEMSWAEFKASKPKNPLKFRACLKLDSYYNYEFKNKENDYWSINLSEINFNSFDGSNLLNIYGYVKKDSEAGKKLFEYLKDGKTKIAIIELKYPHTNENNSNCVEISNLITIGISENLQVEQIKK